MIWSKDEPPISGTKLKGDGYDEYSTSENIDYRFGFGFPHPGMRSRLGSGQT
jgi:hypothetical protein